MAAAWRNRVVNQAAKLLSTNAHLSDKSDRSDGSDRSDLSDRCAFVSIRGCPFASGREVPHSTVEMKTDIQQRLQSLREALLGLHKTLVDSERVNYEQTFGPIPSANRFLQLLTGDPWFAWLHSLSQLIVAMDEVMDGEKPATSAD